MENPVISREYIEKNYIKKDIIEKTIQYVLSDITGEGEEVEYGARCMAREIRKILEETEDENRNTNNVQVEKEQSADINKY